MRPTTRRLTSGSWWVATSAFMPAPSGIPESPVRTPHRSTNRGAWCSRPWATRWCRVRSVPAIRPVPADASKSSAIAWHCSTAPSSMLPVRRVAARFSLAATTRAKIRKCRTPGVPMWRRRQASGPTRLREEMAARSSSGPMRQPVSTAAYPRMPGRKAAMAD